MVDHDALAGGADAGQAVVRVPRQPGGGTVAVYRGWMLSSGRYAAFAAALADRGVALRTTAGQYRRAHELPGWYPALASVTPTSVWTAGDGRGGFDRARRRLGSGPAVLRDYTKSMKHYWHEAMYIPDLNDAAAAWRVAGRFRQLREDEFTGGFVLRRFEQFAGAQARTWWVHGRCRLIGAHPDTPHDTPSTDLDISGVAPLVAALRLPLVTVDMVRRGDGAWRIVELGDGQVSDRPTTIAPGHLITVMAEAVTATPD